MPTRTHLTCHVALFWGNARGGFSAGRTAVDTWLAQRQTPSSNASCLWSPEKQFPLFVRLSPRICILRIWIRTSRAADGESADFTSRLREATRHTSRIILVYEVAKATLSGDPLPKPFRGIFGRAYL